MNRKRVLYHLFGAILLLVIAPSTLFSENSDKIIAKANTFINNGEFSKATTFLEKSINKQYDKKTALFLAEVYRKLQDDKSLIRILEYFHLQEITLKNPVEDKILLKLADLYLNNGEYDKSLSWLERVHISSYDSKRIAGSISYARKELINNDKNDSIILRKIENINTSFDEYFPTVTFSNNEMIFTRRLPKEGALDNNVYNFNEDFFLSKKEDSLWGVPSKLVSVNTPLNEGASSISSDGNVLFFTRCERECKLFYSKKSGNNFSAGIIMPGNINKGSTKQPSFNQKEMTLYFASNVQGGFGGYDLYKTTYIGDDKWSNPENLGAKINTPKDEQTPFITADGNMLYFSSNGHFGMGRSDIYLSKRDTLTLEFQEVLNLGYPTNTFGQEEGMVITPLGDKVLFASKRGTPAISLDIYEFNLPKKTIALISQPISEKYPDTATIKINIPITVGEKYTLKNILFITGSSILDTFSFKELNRLVTFLKENPKVEIKLIGHTDNIGKEEDNITLSHQRAQSVSNYLVTKNISSSRLSFEGKGETFPIATNDSEQGRSLNRRVEIEIVKTE